jgi:polysaccharide deacetylase 2 family uncharacterized protein YibQ
MKNTRVTFRTVAGVLAFLSFGFSLLAAPGLAEPSTTVLAPQEHSSGTDGAKVDLLDYPSPDPVMANPHTLDRLTLQPPAAYQVVFDVEDPCFEFLSGSWALSKAGSYTGSFYYDLPGPGDGSARGRWIAEGLPAGTYQVEYYCGNDDYPADARYQVAHAGGIDDLQVNMRYVGDGWHTLGTFSCDSVCVVTVTDFWEGAGSKIAVDALRFTLTTALPSPPSSPVPPHIGLCIDDAGSVNPTLSTTPIYQMLRLPFSMTFAVLPARPYTAQTAQEVQRLGSEVLLHQPMAAISVPDPGTGGITDAMSLEDVRTVVTANLDALPEAVGLNNHMGSLITQQTDKMEVCIDVLKKRGLFFYDSRTITTSVAYDVAKSKGLLTAERDLFIDDATAELCRARVLNLALRALHAPEVPHLAIGHVRSATADGLALAAPELEAMGVEIWPISRCLSQVVEVDSQPEGASINKTGSWTQVSLDSPSEMTTPEYSIVLNNPAATHSDSVSFLPALPVAGTYDVFAIWPLDSLQSPEIRARVATTGGLVEIPLPADGNRWTRLGRFPLPDGAAGSVTLHDESCVTPGRVFRADAVRYDYAGPLPPLRVKEWRFR